MRELFALLIAGVGLCFFALELVSTGLQETTSRTIRTLIRRSTKSRWSCAAIGLLAGGIIQSTSAVTVVLGSMATAGMVTLQQALPIVAFANVGTTALVFAGALDIRIAVLFAVGIAGIAFSMTGQFKWKAMSSVVLGVALLLYGSDLRTSAASDVEQANWFSNFLHTWNGSTLMAFGLGTIASFLTQSTTTVALVSVALASAGQLNLAEAVTMIYGANLGSTLMRILLTQGRTGTLRQVSRFQDIFKIAGAVVFGSLFLLETIAGIPLVQALVVRVTSSLPLQLATVNLLFNGSMAVLATVFSAPVERFVAATWPPSAVEDLSAPKYVNIEAAGDPETAIDLLEKEQMRVLKATRDYLSLIRPDDPRSGTFNPTTLHFSFSVLFREIEHFYNAIVSQHVDTGTSGRLGNVHGRQKLLELVEDSLFQLASSVTAAASGGKLEHLIATFVDALDFLLMFSGDAARTLDRGRAELVFDLSSDRGEMMASLRNMHLAPEHALTSEEKALLLRLTNLFERIVWMVQRYADLLIKNVDALEGKNAL
jgi:phosphate:Na+ symporter